MKLTLDPRSRAPLHAQVEALIRSLLSEPQYQDGKLLPPEKEIASRLGVSRSTVRAGLDRLVQQGMIVRQAGRGTQVVAEHLRTSRMESWESFTREMAAKGVEVVTFCQQYGWRSATANVAEALGIERGRKVLSLRRVRGFDGKRIVHFRSWFHPCLGLRGDEDFSRPLYDVLAEASCLRPERSQELIAAIAATPSLARALAVASGTPLLERRRRVTDARERPIEYAVNHYVTTDFAYAIDVRRGRR